MQGIICPIGTCQTVNGFQVDVCIRCGTPLQGYKQLKLYPAQLFNAGLAKAREGQFQQARDFFTAVVLWCPMDMEARNALAMACFAQGDHNGASHQWSMVLEQIPTNALALHGLEILAEAQIKTLSANKAQKEMEISPIKNGRKKKIISLYTLVGWG